ncbi:MAG: hypothetical protein R2710_05260 [Acidimicrobiales bacterium]
MRLINGIRPPDELLAFSVDYAKQLVASVAGGSLRASRQQVYRDLHGDIGTSVVDSMRLLNEMMGGDEYREGVAGARRGSARTSSRTLRHPSGTAAPPNRADRPNRPTSHHPSAPGTIGFSPKPTSILRR